MPFPGSPAVETEAARPEDWLTPRRFVALLAVLTVAAYPQVFFGSQTFVYRDFGLFSYPIAYHLRESFWHGELPLWNPLSNCGIPFLAQWNTQVLYPPALFYLLLPLSWSLGVFCLLHLFWGGWGMFRLARHWTQNNLAAAFAGIVFAFNGLMLNSLMWPATIAALGWMPWIVWLTERAWREGGRTLILAALAGAMQMLSGGTEVILLTWLLLGALNLLAFRRENGSRAKILWRGLWVVLLISGLAAAQLLPFFDLLHHSRSQQNISAALWPMPLTGWANFFVPLFHCRSYQGVFMQDNQSWTNSYYVGVATVVLALGAWRWWRQGRVWLPAALAGFCFVLALGDATPIYGWWSRHTGVGGIRFPIKFVILPVFVLPLLAAQTLAGQTTRKGTDPARRRGIRSLVWLGMTALILGLLGWNWHSRPTDADQMEVLTNGLSRLVFFSVLVAGGWFAYRSSTPAARRLWQLLLLLVVWLDLFLQAPQPQTVNPAIFQPGLSRPLSAPRWGESRAMVPVSTGAALGHLVLPEVSDDYLGRRFTLGCNCNLLDNLPACDGFFPLYPDRYVAVYYTYDKDSTAAPLLDFSGVSEILVLQTNRCEWEPRSTAMPLLTGGQRPRFTDDLTAVCALTNAVFDPRREVCLPVAAKNFITASNETRVDISAARYGAQRIEAEVMAAAPAVLVVAQIYYPPWQAYVDGRPTRLWPANYAFQALAIPAGAHRVKLVYEDGYFRFGVVISLVTLAGCLAGYGWRWARKLP